MGDAGKAALRRARYDHLDGLPGRRMFHLRSFNADEVASNRQRLTRDAPKGMACPSKSYRTAPHRCTRAETRTRCSSSRSACALLMSCAVRRRRAHPPRRRPRREALGADGQRASLDAMRGAAQRRAVGALERDLQRGDVGARRPTPAPPALRRCLPGRRRAPGCARGRSDSRPARPPAARSATGRARVAAEPVRELCAQRARARRLGEVVVHARIDAPVERLAVRIGGEGDHGRPVLAPDPARRGWRARRRSRPSRASAGR